MPQLRQQQRAHLGSLFPGGVSDGWTFLSCWLRFGHLSPALALINCLILAGLIAATFIDFEHFIIPDEITIGGIVVGFVCSFFFPAMHGVSSVTAALKQSLLGMGVGAGLIYAIVRLGKLAFGRHNLRCQPKPR